ncbi:MAG: hemolysin family protein [Gemmatimonadales bacterium]|nr:hemolysin family protein [Gemmatimonadales bacterium]
MELLLILVLLFLSAAFSGSETAFFSLGRGDLAKLEAEGGPAGRRVARMLAKATDLLSALLIGNLLVNTAVSVLTTSLCLRWLGPRGLIIAVPVVTLLLLLLGEITPKMLALRARRRVALLAQRPLKGWLFINDPVLRLISTTVGSLLRALPFERPGHGDMTTAELQTACELAIQDGTLSETEGRSLARLLNLEDMEVIQIMTPRTAVISLRRDMSLRQILGTARRAGFNRYPVLEPGGERPVGLFHLKDLLLQKPVADHPLDSGWRDLLFVPESKNVAALLAEMGDGGSHLAAVVDEHGDFTGIVTMADCLQALIGPVADTPRLGSEMIPQGEGRWIISGRTYLRELQETCGVSLPPSRDYVTVAGFLMSRLGRVLEPGDTVDHLRTQLEVLEMTGHRLDKVQLSPLKPDGRSAPCEGGDSC